MIRIFLLISLCLLELSLFSEISASSMTFTPGPSIMMTGSSDRVFFDVVDDLTASSITDKNPTLTTSTSTFSGAFYLSGAGWTLFDTGSYRVDLDCGSQILDSLTTFCTLSGTAWNENIGDIVFDRRVKFDPMTTLLSGTASTFIGEYSFSGVRLPLLPAEFIEGKTITASGSRALTLSGSQRYYGGSAWNYRFQPVSGNDRAYATLSNLDFSHASLYTVNITDPNGSVTNFSDFRVLPDVPHSTLDANIGSSVRKDFCTTTPILCPDGEILTAMTLTKTPLSPTQVVANGTDKYDFTLKIRDRYGNATNGGSVNIEYTDRVDTIQVSQSEYGNISDYCIFGSGCAIIGGGIMDISTNKYGKYFYSGTISGDIIYSFSSLAPTDTTNTFSLSGILYTDALGVTSDITDPSWKTALVFTPWYSSALSIPGDIEIGTGVGFSGSLTYKSLFTATRAGPIYRIDIGDNSFASFTGFTGSPDCTKFYMEGGTDACNWFDPFAVFLSTPSTTFTGTYTPYVADPLLERVTYKSYVTYVTGGIRVLYPSGSGSLGGASYARSSMKILGQNNLGAQYSGIGSKNKGDIWNMIRKNTALLSRSRTIYSDVDYQVQTGTLTLTDASFARKRSYVVIGADIRITGNIAQRDTPLAIIALTDGEGRGGNITIDASVTDIDASLFAEHAVSSSGDRQLYIHGSFISANTAGDTVAKICPYYVMATCDQTEAKKYDLEYIRPDFDPGTSPLSLSPTAVANPGVALLIEYDGRLLSDPPPGLAK